MKQRRIIPSLCIPLVTIIALLSLPHPLLAGGDAAPFGSIEFWPTYFDASALGRGGATLAMADSPISGLFNPASMLTLPMAALELSYVGQWGDHPLDPTYQKDFTGRLRSFAIRLSGAGFGLMFYRHRPFQANFEWSLDARNTLEGTFFPAEAARIDAHWRATGLNIAMRVSYDFSIGVGIQRDRFRLNGLSTQQGLNEGEMWRLQYDADASDWSYSVGAVWDMTPDFQIAFTYLWGPIVDLPVQIENLAPESAEPPRQQPVRFGLPDVLAFGFHARQGRYHLVFDARRMKTGRLRKDPWLMLLAGPDDTFRFENAWDIRIGIIYEAMMGQTPVQIQLGAWNKPTMLPVWDGSPDSPHAAFLSRRWPGPDKEWHWSAGLQFRLTRTFQLSFAGITGPRLRTFMISLTTLFK